MTSKANLITILFASFIMIALGACGVEDSDPSNPTCVGDCCGDSCDAPDPCANGKCDTTPEPTPAPEYLPCPFTTDGPFNWNVAGKYISGASKGELRFFTAHSDGTYPNPQVVDSNESGYLGMYYEIDEGYYRFSYLGYQYSEACQEGDCPEAWAQYGDKDSVLAQLSPECRAFIDCNWWDADNREVVDVDCAECALKVYVESDGTIWGAGNMSNLTE
jgi:hypothetical protein